MAIPSWYQAQISTTIPAPTNLVKDIQHIIVSTIIGSTIHTNDLNVNTISSSTIQTNTLFNRLLLGSTIQTNKLITPDITTNTSEANILYFTILNGSTIQANVLQYSTIIGYNVETSIQDTRIIIGSSIQSNTLNVSSVLANSIQSNTINVSSLINSISLTSTLYTSSSFSNNIQTKILTASTIASDNIQLNNLYTSTLTGSTLMGIIFQIGALNISSTYGSSIQTNTLQVNTLSGSTIQTNSFIASTIMITCTNIIQINTLNVHTVNANTIIYSTIQTNNLSISDEYNTMTTSTLQTNLLYYSTLTGSTIQINTLHVNTLLGSTFINSTLINSIIQTNTLNVSSLIGSTIQSNTISGSIITVSTINANQIYTNTITGSTLSMNRLSTSTIIGSSIQTNQMILSTVTYSTIQMNILNGNMNVIGDDIYTNTIANTLICSTIQSDTFTGVNLYISTLTCSTIIGNTIQTSQLNISTVVGSSIIGSNLQSNRILITDGNKALSTSVVNASQLLHITGLKSQAGGIGQINTWTSTNTFTKAPIFTGLSTSLPLNKLGMTIDNRLIKYQEVSSSAGILGAISMNYIPYATAISTLSTSIIYRVNATDIAIGQTSSSFPTGTETTLSVAGQIQTTSITATTGTFSKIFMDDKRNGLNGILIPGNQGCDFYMGTMNNNNSGNYTDTLYLNSWADSSAGNINAVMFNKSTIGMRIYQGAVGETSNFTAYKDAIMIDANSGNITLGQNSDTRLITFGPSPVWSSYLKIGAEITPSYNTRVAHCYVNNGNLYLDSGVSQMININTNANTMSGGTCITELFGDTYFNGINEQEDYRGVILVLDGVKLRHSQAITKTIVSYYNYSWGSGVNTLYAFHKNNPYVSVNISGYLSYYVNNGILAKPEIRIKHQTSSTLYYYSLEAYTNYTHPRPIQFFELILSYTDLPNEGWYDIYVYNKSNCITDSNDQLVVNVTILPTSEFT